MAEVLRTVLRARLGATYRRPPAARSRDVVTPQVQWAGNLSTAVGITAAVLVIVGHRFGPMLAALTGIPVGLGVAAVHLLPRWSAFSDAFPGAHNTGVTALSWSVVIVEIGRASCRESG